MNAALKLSGPQVRLIDPTPEAASIWRSLSDAQRAQIAHRRSIVAAWRSRVQAFKAAGGSTTDATASILLEHRDLSQSTLYRWGRLVDDPDPSALLDRRTARGEAESTATARSIGDLAWSRFLELFLTIDRRTVAVCHLVVAEESRRHADDPAWCWPSLRTVQLAAQKIPPTQRDFHRLGEKEWRRRYELSIPRDYEEYRPGEYYVGDFHQFDVFCRRSESDATILRPLLGAFLDLRSRCVVGWNIGEHENADTVLITIADAIRKHGCPHHVVIDNGKPYRAAGVSGGRPKSTRLIDDEEGFRKRLGVLPGLQIGVHFSIPFNPNSKIIERWFRTLEEQFCACLPGYCGGEKDDRFRDAWKRAHDAPQRLLTIAQLIEKFAKYLEGYHATPHAGEGMNGLTPSLAFEQLNPVPKAILPEDVLEFLILRTVGPRLTQKGDLKYPRVTKNGVAHQGIQYGSSDPRLWELIGKDVTLRVHPTQADWIWVCDIDGRPIVKAINNRLALAGVTRDDVAEGMKAKKRSRRFARQIKEGAALPALDSVADAAVQARISSGQLASQQLIAATGTDSCGTGVPPVRGVSPLRSDLADVSRRLARQVDRPPVDPDLRFNLRAAVDRDDSSFDPAAAPAFDWNSVLEGA